MKAFRLFTLALLPAFALLGVLTLTQAAVPDDKDPATKDKQVDPKIAEYMEDLAMVGRLTDLGRKQSSPESLLSAAFLLRKISTTGGIDAMKEKPEVEGEKEAPKPVEVDYKHEIEELITQAREIAAERKLNLEPLIKDVENRQLTRRVLKGPRQINQKLQPGKSHSYHITVKNKEPFYLSFRASSPLRVTVVRSDNDNALAAGIIPAANANWTPSGGKAQVPITIRFANPGAVPVTYQMVLN